ncbi:hypothetical protein ASC66_17380 [Leifsonia sp. Root4]|nr:hypothetical protein ASC66_17380 [Leifsonia sp. Root4]
MPQLRWRRIRSGLRVRRCSFVAAPLAQANVHSHAAPMHAGLREQPRNEAAPEALSAWPDRVARVSIRPRAAYSTSVEVRAVVSGIRSGLRGRRCSFVAAQRARAHVPAGSREQPRNEAAPEALSV